ncbi:ABC transporter ATP-binding protein [Lacticaseibacillus zeae]|uniref:ABC transporter ATP-binding protein n=1 Tax=Lacticaseibacillus zeae TaxID=57037 RepID=A0A5R8LR76_LACZE|nr:ABC transporter ATP-binding protein [Lacticaseibacillus zeae]TLF39668.1 ABC transporter ATP-binding protein [Lacticaseibacillus zeae]
MTLLRIDHAKKVYKKRTAIFDASMSFNGNGLYLIAGPNGSGKTTLLESIVGLRRLSSGSIVVEPNSAKIAFLFQENNLRKLNTVREEFQLVLKLYQRNISERQVADQYQLTEFLDTRTVNLSGGTKRRVLIAMTLMTEAPIVILDEPASGLDTFNRKEIWNLIKQYGKNHLVIVSDHYLNQAADYCDFVYMLHAGRIVESGLIPELESQLRKFVYTPIDINQLRPIERDLKEQGIDYISRSTGKNFYLYTDSSVRTSNILNNHHVSIHSLTFEDGYLMYTGDDVNE